MPVVVEGLYEFNKALKQFDKDIQKNLNKEIRSFLAPVVSQAKSYVIPNSQLTGLRTGWTRTGKATQITSSTSMFRRGKFPKYNAAEIKAGIKYYIGNYKRQPNGWIAPYRIANESGSGAIFETSGRAMGQSKRTYKSPNPSAGQHFMDAIDNHGQMKGIDKRRGRLIFRAFNENQGKALTQTIKAIEAAKVQFAHRVDTRKAFKAAA